MFMDYSHIYLLVCGLAELLPVPINFDNEAIWTFPANIKYLIFPANQIAGKTNNHIFTTGNYGRVFVYEITKSS